MAAVPNTATPAVAAGLVPARVPPALCRPLAEWRGRVDHGLDQAGHKGPGYRSTVTVAAGLVPASVPPALCRPIVARPMGWEKSGSWVNPEAFPPFGGDQPFRKMAAQLKADGNRLFMYWEGYQWSYRAKETGYDGTERFEKFFCRRRG